MPDDEELPPFQPLRTQRAGLPLDTSLYEDPPDHLVPFLRGWVEQTCRLDPFAARRVAFSLDLTVATEPYDEALAGAPRDQLLEIDGRQLVDRIDPTVTAAAEEAAELAGPSAGELLRDAWRRIYGREHEPTTAYRQAVRAVEEVACQLVLPKTEERTLGKVIAHLKQSGHKWRFALVDRDDVDTVDTLVGMLDRLWTGQVSRHGGAKKSRDQTQAEAEAAVHLAATVMQLLSTDALTRRDTE